ncbi:vWA domain-containing protein [Maricaulis virginensis]|uniref:VWA domain-containing protein n=1 Tax=Maricaulis virginensis TaxID=144022 RepID=A0A9W6IKY8_9PROT|nr:VWA domain-containing protein [Maricaulis virginensis]GLK51487.1 VWA domain-containing protein [Maricaulis virginensis]
MLHHFFTELRSARIPVTTREYLTLLEALDKGVIEPEIGHFYSVSRAALVKDEKDFDKFDMVFSHVFQGVETLTQMFGEKEIPDEWLEAMMQRLLTEEEMAELKAMDFDELMETLKKRLEEQEERHEGGSKWIGTGGTSPFGHSGYNPAGVRIGGKSQHRRATKVWEQRRYKDLDGDREIGTRNLKVALRRLRKFARDGAHEELDLDNTISATARQGWLDVVMRPERRNAIKVLALFDVGGSMDPHVKLCEELFSAARSTFKNLEYFYFHNCPYEGVWRSNLRRRTETVPTMDVMHKYPHDWKVIIVGDAAMAPYEITHEGGSVEHWNEEAGATWLQRIVDTWPHLIWINPTPQKWWEHSYSTRLVQEIIGADRMFPLTLEGVDEAMKELAR